MSPAYCGVVVAGTVVCLRLWPWPRVFVSRTSDAIEAVRNNLPLPEWLP